MSELPELPPVPRRVRPLPPGGLDAAIRAGRRRRNGVLGAVGGAGMAGVVILVVVFGGSNGGADALLPATDDGSHPSAAPTTGAADVAAARHRQQLAASAAAVARSTGAIGRQPGSASALPLAGGAPSPTAVPTAAAPHRDSYRETPKDAAAPETCRQAPTGWAGPVSYGGGAGCSSASGGPSTVRRGGTVSGTADICVPHGDSPAALGYAGGREHDVVVSNAAGDVVYRFSDTVTFPEGAHHRTVGDGRCLEWTGVWDTRSTSGALVPAGRYDVKIVLLPSTVNGQHVEPGTAGSSGFSVDVQ